MATHDFSKSLNYEKSKFPIQDKFYTETMGAGKIVRVGFEDEESKALQRLDVDARFTYQGKIINVSEKNRTSDYGDLLIEFYSKYPYKRGRMDNSNADYLAYFVPNKVYWINKVELVRFYNNYLKPAIPDAFFEEMVTKYPLKSHRQQKQIVLRGKKEIVSIIQAYNQPSGSSDSWYTESVSVGCRCLRDAGVKIEMFPLTGMRTH